MLLLQLIRALKSPSQSSRQGHRCEIQLLVYVGNCCLELPSRVLTTGIEAKAMYIIIIYLGRAGSENFII